MTQPNTPEIATPADAPEPLATDLEETAPIPSAPMQPAPLGGAPALNANALTHGLDSDPEVGRQRLTLGALPRSLRRVERDAYAFRIALEEAVSLAHGRIDFAAACAVNTASRWERHALLATRWLRERGEAMDDAGRLAYSREIARASAERDKAVASLKLQPESQLTIAATLYGRTA